MKFYPDFATNSRKKVIARLMRAKKGKKKVTCVAFSIEFAKTHFKIAENSESKIEKFG